ncbi:MAG: coniferyl aldehyde dehydrogenase [Myxococcota bacterium]
MSNAAVAPESTVLDTTFARLREAFQAEPYPEVATRKAKLDALLANVREQREALVKAMSEDFGHRSWHESMTYDVLQVVNHIRYAKRNLRGWMAPEPVPLAWTYQPARAEVLSQPLGVVGVIAPWNFPVQLALVPIVYAIAAGNRVLLKPSELTPATADVLASLLEQSLGSDWVGVVTGDAEVGAQFASLPFDHLLFTGSTRVGRLVAKAAAENLTPVTLELGGKSPALVHPDFPTERAAELVAFGKLANSGQICVAPDYVLVRKDQASALVTALQTAMSDMYPKFLENRDYTAIITDRHRARLQELLDDAEQKGAQVLRVNPGNEELEGNGKFVPAIVRGVTNEMRVMQEEIFGPVLPIVETESYEAMAEVVNQGERPLAMYILDKNEARISELMKQTHAGGIAVNETLITAGIESLPFGGVGKSGMGSYHGREGFDTFSHRKSIFRQSRFNLRNLVSPPFGRTLERLLDWLI